MAVQTPYAGLVLMHRLVMIRHLSVRDVLQKLHRCRGEVRTFSTGFVKCDEKEGGSSDPSPLGAKLTSGLYRRRRPLSPLERISSLLPQDALSPEVTQLREQDQHPEPEEDTSTEGSKEESGLEVNPIEEQTETHDASPAVPGERPLMFGELLFAEYRRKGQVEFRKMFQLQAGSRLQSNWGVILHNNIAGKTAGCFLRTHIGSPILVRRASLMDYVTFMRRGPAIAYPKDAATMLMMMDVSEGDCVLESGSGSGAMSLFLSRAVGSKGSVLSVEVREDHHKRAVLNYQRWRTAWSLRRGEEWPDNVHFHVGDLGSASSLLAGRGFNSVALDMVNPHLVLATVVPHLHHGAVCAVYIANITQVIDLLEGIRCLALPLLCEHIVEVPTREWFVAPACHKDGTYCTRKAPVLEEDLSEDEEEEETSNEAVKEEPPTEEHPAFGSIPYIARPHPVQTSHTAFLVKLRKCVQ